MMNKQEEEQRASSYSLTISVLQQKLLLILRDTHSRRTYQSSFTAQQLVRCGFNEQQTRNLDQICKFIQAAKAGKNNWQFQVLIDNKPEQQNDDEKQAQIGNDQNDENSEGGVYGNIVADTQIAPRQQAPPTVAVAIVKISKKLDDAFVGAIEFVMKLPEIEREQNEINKERIDDLYAVIQKQSVNISELMRKQQEQTNVTLKLQEMMNAMNQKIDKMQQQNVLKARVISELQTKVTSLETELKKKERAKEEERAAMRDKLAARVSALEESVKASQAQKGEMEAKMERMKKEIACIQDEEKEKKEPESTVAIVEYKSTKESTTVQWNVVSIAPTLPAMIRERQNNETKIVIGLDGLYRIVFRFCSYEKDVEDWKGKNRGSGIKVNGSWVSWQYHYSGNAVGEMTEIMNLKAGDYIECWMQNKKGTDEDFCALMMERVCECV